MIMKQIIAFLILSISLSANAQNHELIGYWQNWNDSNSPYISLNQVDSRYTVICVSFSVPTSPSDMTMLFTPDGVSQAVLISQMQELQNQGKKIILSIGGATTSISLNNDTSKNAFINSMNTILETYPFDGIDIDIEHGNSILASGTIASPTSPDCINLINAITQIKAHYFTFYNKTMMLTMAPETAYVQGGMSAYGGIWGGYLPILNALRNDINFVHVQLYNSGSVYGIDGNIYTQGTPDFIIAMSEALIHGFSTAGGFFTGFPANKVVVGLPSCPNAAGGGFVSTTQVQSAVNYLMGTGPRSGAYQLNQPAGYSDLGGLMTWSINWDKVTSCNTTSYEFAQNFQQLFGSPLSTADFSNREMALYPIPSSTELFIYDLNQKENYQIINFQGQIIEQNSLEPNGSILITDLKSGLYILKIANQNFKFIKR